MTRIDKNNYYLDIAETVAFRSTCMRKAYGAIIVKNDEIIATGYNGAPRGRGNCSDINFCMRQKLGVLRGERYEMCRSVHAEANAIISASRRDMLDSTLYLVGKDVGSGAYVEGASSCSMCKRLVINAGIKTIVIRDNRDNYRILDINEWIKNDDSLSETGGY